MLIDVDSVVEGVSSLDWVEVFWVFILLDTLLSATTDAGDGFSPHCQFVNHHLIAQRVPTSVKTPSATAFAPKALILFFRSRAANHWLQAQNRTLSGAKMAAIIHRVRRAMLRVSERVGWTLRWTAVHTHKDSVVRQERMSSFDPRPLGPDFQEGSDWV